MEAATGRWPVSLSGLVLLAVVCGAQGQLSTNFYAVTCPTLEFIVREIVAGLPRLDNIGGALNRLAFHDCWVRGCDASVLLQSTSTNWAERDGFANFKLRGLTEIDTIKAKVESVCPGIVSCADIIALAGRDAVVLYGGPSWNVPLGRRDGTVSSAFEANINLPFPNMNFDTLVANFAAKGFNAREMIVLSGAHTIGRAHCNGVQPHLYNFTGAYNYFDADPALDPIFLSQLRQVCPMGNTDTVIPQMDITGGIFDQSYYGGLLAHRGLLTSDTALITNPFGLLTVAQLFSNELWWFSEFANAMVKMSQIGVLTGTQGEIRRNCQFVN